MNAYAPENMYLGVGRQGWGGRCLGASPPREAGRDAAVQVREHHDLREILRAPHHSSVDQAGIVRTNKKKSESVRGAAVQVSSKMRERPLPQH